LGLPKPERLLELLPTRFEHAIRPYMTRCRRCRPSFVSWISRDSSTILYSLNLVQIKQTAVFEFYHVKHSCYQLHLH